MDTIYLDYAATTPMRAEVREAMAPYLAEHFGNPSSVHAFGRGAAAALSEARASVAETLGARPDEILFVRGGTESDNLALQGRVRWIRAQGRTPHLAVSAVEHSAVLETATAVTERGAGVLTVLPVRRTGHVDPDALTALPAGPDTLISVMWVNNETGLVLPVPDMARRAKENGTLLHTDAVQGAGRLRLRVDEVPVDLLTLTGHKIYGPKGTGILFVRRGVELRPLLHGGGQERGLRPGTEDVAGAVGMATALRLAVAEQEEEARRLSRLRDTLEEELLRRLPHAEVVAREGPRAPHIAAVRIRGVPRERLIMALDLKGVAVSGGSACHSGASRPSHVMAALYGPDDDAALVRFSLGRATRTEEVERAVDITARVASDLGEGGAG
ncbi:MAG: cysteine desulfurase family protein [Gemmatimonadota bacterium]